MKENVAVRVRRIISGSVNALVDAVEKAAPEVVMEETLREIDSAIDEVRVELGRVIGNKHLANTRLSDKQRNYDELNRKIELAVAEGRDDLAEAAIAQQLDVEAQIPVLQNSIAENSENERELEGYIAALQAKKRELRQELVRFAASRKDDTPTGNRGEPAPKPDVASRVEKAISAFDRVFEKHTGLAGPGAQDTADAAKLAELEELYRANRIRERLASFKANKEPSKP
jgi:phage shock protein A